MAEITGNLWYYLKPNQEETVGPITADELRFLLTNNKISKQTLVWTEGMENWKEIGTISVLQKTERVKPTISSHGSPKPGSGTPPHSQSDSSSEKK